MVIDGCLQQGFIDRLVGILQFHILADQTNLDGLCRGGLQGKKLAPRLQLRRRSDFQSDLAQDDFVHLLTLQYQRHFVDSRYVDRLDNRVGLNVAEQSHLAEYIRMQLMLCTQNKDVRLNTQLLQLLHGVLRRLRLVLLGRSDVGNVGQMDAEAVLAQLPLQLAHAFDERKRFDVAHRAADFRNHEVELVFIS